MQSAERIRRVRVFVLGKHIAAAAAAAVVAAVPAGSRRAAVTGGLGLGKTEVIVAED